MKINGYLHKFDNNVNTDVIIPARYCTTLNETELAKYCMADIKKDFYKSVKKGDVIVAGENFGCGSSREVAPIAIYACGIRCVVAKSFARIFYRNAINTGLIIIKNTDLFEMAVSGERIEIDFENKIIKINGNNIEFNADRNEIINDIVNQSGLINYIKKRNYKI